MTRMSEPLTTSLAAWRASHGFGILDIISPDGERFLVETQPTHDPSDMNAWVAMSETQLRTYLAERGLSDVDAEDAIALSRQWATTVSGSSVFPTPSR
jgi:hypothetical protein